MNPYEEELQKGLERGQSPKGDELDVRAYTEVFRVLEKDPGYELSSQFAEHVVSTLASRRQKSDDARDYFWFAAGIFVLALTALGTILFTGFRFDFGFLNAMADYKGLAVFAIVFILFLNWLDKRLLKGRQVQH